MNPLKINLCPPEKRMITNIFLKYLHPVKRRDRQALLTCKVDFPCRGTESLVRGREERFNETFGCVRDAWFKGDFKCILPVHDDFLGCATSTGPKGRVPEKTFKHDNTEGPPTSVRSRLQNERVGGGPVCCGVVGVSVEDFGGHVIVCSDDAVGVHSFLFGVVVGGDDGGLRYFFVRGLEGLFCSV